MQRLVLAPLSLVALASPFAAQTIERVTPEVASPGYLATFDGTDLGATTHVRFTAFVGGFVGVWTVDVPVESAEPARVTAFVPEINAWIPPWVGPKGGSPFGDVRAVSTAGAATSSPAPFYFLEGTSGLLENVGLGSTHFGGERAVVSFDPGTPVIPAPTDPWKSIGTGAPFPGNADFVARLNRATPASPAFLLVGRPGPPIPIDDGFLAVDPAQIFAVLLGTGVDANGDASVALPIPPSADGFGPVAMQWVFIEGFVPVARLSSGLQANWL